MRLKEFSVHIAKLAALNYKTAVVAAATCIAFFTTPSAFGRIYHVAVTGSDKNPGSATEPLKTIQAAAERAQPGDTVRVHEGTYRERVNPPRGGTSERKRIIYQAAPGEKVEIKGSEVIKGWSQVQDDTWQVTLPNSFFGGFNPYRDLIRGDWFDPKKREHQRAGDVLPRAIQANRLGDRENVPFIESKLER
jgi:alpha-N-arabinofuranosidase